MKHLLLEATEFVIICHSSQRKVELVLGSEMPLYEISKGVDRGFRIG